MSTTFSIRDYYLHETWSPDRELVNGEIVERNLGGKSHAAWQIAFCRILSELRISANIRVYPELRLQTSSTNFRIPDVMAIDRNAPDEEIITHAPLLCVEILSPDDRFSKMEEKVEEYFATGVRAVWIIDPLAQTGYQCEGARLADWKISPTLVVSGTPIRIEMSDIIADLD
jgi:Uma2 family endonuclease